MSPYADRFNLSLFNDIPEEKLTPEQLVADRMRFEYETAFQQDSRTGLL